MTTNAATVAAALRRLAEAEEACPQTDLQDNQSVGGQLIVGYHMLRCLCHGAGRVPLFRDAEGKALFRKPCLRKGCFDGRVVVLEHTGPEPTDIEQYEDSCEQCHGRGWLPLDIGEVHLETVLCCAYNIESERRAVTFKTYMACIAALDELPRGSSPQAFIEAALLALDAAVEARA